MTLQERLEQEVENYNSIIEQIEKLGQARLEMLGRISLLQEMLKEDDAS